MLTEAAWACFMGAHIQAGLTTAREAAATGDRAGGTARTLANAVLGIGLVLSGEADRALALLREYETTFEAELELADPHRLLRPAGQILTWFEEYDRARRLLDRMVAAARGQSALGVLPYVLAERSELDFRTGNWISAYAAASESARITETPVRRACSPSRWRVWLGSKGRKGARRDGSRHRARSSWVPPGRRRRRLRALGARPPGPGRTG